MSEIAGRWLRVSSGAQDEASQEPDVNGYVTKHGYAEGPTYTLHGESASKGEQDPYVEQVIADGKAGKLHVLVAWHVDRLDRRGPWATGLMVQALNRAGVRVETTDGGVVSDRDLNGLVKQWSAREESEHKARRIRAKHAALRAAGSWCSGRSPLGYSLVTLLDGRKTLEPNDDAPTVRRIFELTAEGQSYGEVARTLAAEGIKTPGGQAHWHQTVIGQTVRNPVFRGLVNYQGKTYMTVEGIVGADLWQRANADVKTRTTSKSFARRGSGRPSPSFLSPRCGRCGSPMYRYGLSYRCQGKPGARRCAGPDATRTDANTIKVELLDAEVLAYFSDSDEDEISETVTAGVDYAEEIAEVELAIGDLSPRAPGYRDEHDRLMAELDRLIALPVIAPAVKVTKTGRTEGDVFRDMTPEEQRAHLKAWQIIVSPDRTLERRWEARYLHNLTPSETDEILARKLAELRA